MGLMDSRARTTTVGSIALLVVLGISSTWLFSNDSSPIPSAVFSPTARVTQGPFEVHVNAAATIDARQSVTLSSDLPSNKAKLLYLADEGVLLQAGDTVARFDTSPFEEEIRKHESDIRELQASLKQAQAERALLEQEVADRKAELDYQVVLAGISRSNLERVDIPNREQLARKTLTKTEADHRRAQRELATQQKLLDQGLSRRSELEDAQDIANEKRAAYDIAKRELETLVDITFPAELKQARLNHENRQRQQANYGEVSQQRLTRQSASLEKIRNRLNGAEQNLQKTQNYLLMTELTAPVTGIVLYKRIGQGAEKRKPQVGDSVWNRNAFAVMPDMSSLVAYARVDEKDMGRMALGQPAAIAPEAYRGVKLSGTVDAIGTLANEEHDRGATRYFSVRIALDEPDARLRPGMSARASILASAYPDVTKVPLEAVFYENDLPVGFLYEGGKHRRVALELGDTDGNHIVVHSGLEVGQQVSLLYPKDAESR